MMIRLYTFPRINVNKPESPHVKLKSFGMYMVSGEIYELRYTSSSSVITQLLLLKLKIN